MPASAPEPMALIDLGVSIGLEFILWSTSTEQPTYSEHKTLTISWRIRPSAVAFNLQPRRATERVFAVLIRPTC